MLFASEIEFVNYIVITVSKGGQKMDVLMIVLGAVLLVLAVAIVALVLMQQGKDKKLSGAIAGGADTFYGKNKTADKDKILSIVTAILSVVFVLIVLAMYFIV